MNSKNITKIDAESNRIAHVSFSNSGGAGRMASLLANYQTKKGIDAVFVTSIKGNLAENKFKDFMLTSTSLTDFYIVRKSIRNPLFTLFRRRSLAVNLQDFDVIHLHWTPGVIGFDEISRLYKNGKKIVWTFHDMWPLTGGCHHALDCLNYLFSCQRCPQVRSIFQKTVAKNFELKKIFFESSRSIELVAPSKWLKNILLESNLFEQDQIHVIPNPIDLENFKPLENPVKSSNEQSEIILGISAVDANDPLKNIPKLIEWVMRINNENIFKFKVTLVIQSKKNIKNNINDSFIVYSNYSYYTMNQFYNDIDVYVNNSIAENSPLTIIEAMAVGVPVLANSTGGAPELVENNVTGFLYCDWTSFIDGVSRLTDRAKRISMGQLARKYVIKNHSIEAIAEAYGKLYKISQ